MQSFGYFHRIPILGKKNVRRLFQSAIFAYFFVFANFASTWLMSQETLQTLTDSTVASTVFLSSTEKLQRLKTIEANIRMAIFVDGVEFAAHGKYEEQAVRRPELSDFYRCLFRLELHFLMDAGLKAGSTPNQMTVVCHISEGGNRADDEVWRYVSVEGAKEISFVKLAVLDQAIQKAKAAPKKVPCLTTNEVWNLGGLLATLRQLDRFYAWNSMAEEVVLPNTHSAQLWKLTGTLRPERLEALVKSHGGLGKNGEFPQDLPTDVELYLGKENGFPYKIAYFNRAEEKSGKRNLLSQISYFDVRLDEAAISMSRFPPLQKMEQQEAVYNPVNQTNAYLRLLGL